MTTQVTFTTNPSLKKETLQKTKKDGITLKAFFTFCMKGYLQGKINLGITTSEKEIEEIEVTPSIQKKMDAIAKLL